MQSQRAQGTFLLNSIAWGKFELTDQLGARPVALADMALIDHVPILPRHPRWFLLAYWLPQLLGAAITQQSSIGEVRLVGTAISVVPLVLLITYAWQIAQYTGGLGTTVDGAKRSQPIAAALALLALGAGVLLIFAQPPPEQIAQTSVWMHVAIVLVWLRFLACLQSARYAWSGRSAGSSFRRSAGSEPFFYSCGLGYWRETYADA